MDIRNKLHNYEHKKNSNMLKQSEPEIHLITRNIVLAPKQNFKSPFRIPKNKLKLESTRNFKVYPSNRGYGKFQIWFLVRTKSPKRDQLIPRASAKFDLSSQKPQKRVSRRKLQPIASGLHLMKKSVDLTRNYKIEESFKIKTNKSSRSQNKYKTDDSSKGSLAPLKKTNSQSLRAREIHRWGQCTAIASLPAIEIR